MLKNISWQSFFSTIGWILSCYYLFVAIVYYRKDMHKIISFKTLPFGFVKPGAVETVEEQRNDPFELASRLRKEIAKILQKAYLAQYQKEELVMALQLSVREYPELQQSAFQVAINHYISQESEKQCSTSLNDEELRMIWMG